MSKQQSNVNPQSMAQTFSGLTIALSKGRILDETLPLLANANIELVEDPSKSRKLVFPTSRKDVRILIIRAADVPTYVEYGAADMGVAGKDVVMEHGGEGLYEPLDLKIAKCKLMVAEPTESVPHRGRRKVATKYVKLAKKYFAEKGQQVEIIKLYGSMELAPLVGLADSIVDVVDTGNTLKANGLMPTELIATISSRLIVNKAAMKMKHQAIQEIVDRVGKAVSEQKP